MGVKPVGVMQSNVAYDDTFCVGGERTHTGTTHMAADAPMTSYECVCVFGCRSALSADDVTVGA